MNHEERPLSQICIRYILRPVYRSVPFKNKLPYVVDTIRLHIYDNVLSSWFIVHESGNKDVIPLIFRHTALRRMEFKMGCAPL